MKPLSRNDLFGRHHGIAAQPNPGRQRVKHLRASNDLNYTDAEKAFALRLQETFEDRPPLEQIHGEQADCDPGAR